MQHHPLLFARTELRAFCCLLQLPRASGRRALQGVKQREQCCPHCPGSDTSELQLSGGSSAAPGMMPCWNSPSVGGSVERTGAALGHLLLPVLRMPSQEQLLEKKLRCCSDSGAFQVGKNTMQSLVNCFEDEKETRQHFQVPI